MSWPPVTSEHRRAVDRVLDSGYLTEGPEVEALETEWAAWSGRRYAIAVSSGTAAIEVALLAAGIRRGSYVGIPAYTFAGSALGASRIGATIRWADVDRTSYVSERGHWRAIAAVDAAIVVHLFGRAAPIPEDVPVVVEDCAQAYGTASYGLPVGRAGIVACWSLNRCKTVWAGEGGIVATDDAGLADEIRALRCFGGKREPASGEASNWKLAEIPAALARVSLGLVDEYVDRARRQVARFSAALGDDDRFVRPGGDGHSFHQYRLAWPDAPFETLRSAVPITRWQPAPLPAARAFGAYPAEQWPGATFTATQTFSVGGDDYPPCAWTDEQVDGWAATIRRAT